MAAFLHHWVQTPLRPICFRAASPFACSPAIFAILPLTPPQLWNSPLSKELVLVTEAKKDVFVAKNPNPLHDPPEPPANDPPTKPLHDPPGVPTYEPPQPSTDPTPNPASDPPRELPRGVAWW